MVRCVWDAKAILGEGPLWCHEQRCLYWVDIKGKAVHLYKPHGGLRQTFPAPEEICALGKREGGGFIAAARSGITLWDPSTNRFSPVASPEPELPHNRFNDGKCDRFGRFWAGTMDDAATEPTGSLYWVSSEKGVTQMLSGFIVTNGI